MSSPEAIQVRIDELIAERDSLRTQVHQLQEQRDRKGRLRAIAVVVLIALACVTFTNATVGVWAKRSVLNNEVFVKRVAPLGNDPAVHDALATWMTAQLMEVVDPGRLFSEVLPDKGQILVIPLEGAVAGFVHDQIIRFMETDTFANLWTLAVQKAHEQVVRVIKGQSQVITGQDKQIVINLVPLLNEVLAQISGLTPQLFGETIRLPELTVDQLPETAQQRLSDALGLPITGDFGIIQIDDGGRLEAIQKGVQIAQAAMWALIILTTILTLGALALSRQRRRTLLQLMGGLIVGMVIVRRGAMLANREALAMIVDPTVKAAGASVIRQFTNPLVNTATAMLWTFVAIAAVTLITGPYKWAADLRPRIATVSATAVGTVRQAGSRVTDEATLAWMRANSGALQIAGVAVFVILLIVTNLGWFGTGVLLAMFAAFEGAVWWLGESAKRAPLQTHTLTQTSPEQE